MAFCMQMYSLWDAVIKQKYIAATCTLYKPTRCWTKLQNAWLGTPRYHSGNQPLVHQSTTMGINRWYSKVLLWESALDTPRYYSGSQPLVLQGTMLQINLWYSKVLLWESALDTPRYYSGSQPLVLQGITLQINLWYSKVPPWNQPL
jgi:hypothetical protein